jgi:membrane protein DedA with SNARE-associated domain
VRQMNFSRRLILPAAGVVVFVIGHLAQNVLHLFHVEDIARTIHGFDRANVALGVAVLGFIEATVILCFYVPGTAVMILLLLGLHPTLAEALPLLFALMVGTMIGYVASLALGRILQQRLPSLVGETYFRKVQSWIDRYGLLAVIPGGFHPNQLAMTFAILGYFRTGAIWQYYLLAAVAQAGWWAVYFAVADLFASQKLVSSNNFQLYVAALFLLWFIYELFARPHPQNVP